MITEVRLEEFTEHDIDNLISWIHDEKELIQFAGPKAAYPLSKDQLYHDLNDPNRHIFKIIHHPTNSIIGHGEVYHSDAHAARLCRILIGDPTFRGRGYGTSLTKLLTDWSFEHLKVNLVELNVYDFNISAIKSYEKVGFKKTTVNEVMTSVGDENWSSFRMEISRDEFYGNRV